MEKNIKPWMKDKRGWIFYLDKIKDDPDMVYGGINEGNVYLLDCQTAKLSLWLEKWNVFTEMGVSDLLSQIDNTDNRKNIPIPRVTRILYKGIELQNAYLEQDTELLEYIDIKGDIRHEFLNISRNGFTEKGERYFKGTIYPAILEGLRDIFALIEKQAIEDGKENNFVSKIKRNALEFCKRIRHLAKIGDIVGMLKEKREFISLLVTSAVLSYYAMRDEWDIMEKYEEGRTRVSVWEELIEVLVRVLEENGDVLQMLAENSVLFNIQIISGDSFHAHVVRGEERHSSRSFVHFLNIFQRDVHWAILQKRKIGDDSWSSYLILLGDSPGTNRPIYELFSNIPHNQRDIDGLEFWGEQLCDELKDSETTIDAEFSDMRNQQPLLDWMLRSIPTIGLFCTPDGNMRVNVLSGRIFPSIFMSTPFKRLLLERLIREAQGKPKRFSTVTWQGKERLAVKDLPFSIYFVKEGYFSDKSYHKCIVPLERDQLVEWGKVLAQKPGDKAVLQIKRLCQEMNILMYLQDSRSSGLSRDAKRYLERDYSAALNIATELLTIILSKVKEMGFAPVCEFDELMEENTNRLKEWIQIYNLCATMVAKDTEEYLPEGDRLSEELNSCKGWDTLCSAWMYCCILQDRIAEGRYEISDLNKNYESALQKDDQIVFFLQKNLDARLKTEVIQRELKDYRREWELLALQLEQECLLKYVNELLPEYTFFVQKIKNEYEDFLDRQNYDRMSSRIGNWKGERE